MQRPEPRSRSIRTAALGAALAVVLAACSSAATPAPTAAPSAAPTVAAKGLVNLGQDAKLGAYLAGADGKSLYLFTKDSKDKSTPGANVIVNWPPLLVTSATDATAGAGVTGTLATIKRDDGTTQVTYNGIPLYYFAKDTKAGDFGGQGVSGVWFLVAPTATAASGTIVGGINQTGTPTAAPSAGAQATGAPGAVTIANLAFAPGTLSVAEGTTVKWTNNDGEAHTVTATNGSFDSKNLDPGKTFEQKFATAGSFTYMCTIHPTMTGTVTVVAVAAY